MSATLQGLASGEAPAEMGRMEGEAAAWLLRISGLDKYRPCHPVVPCHTLLVPSLSISLPKLKHIGSTLR